MVPSVEKLYSGKSLETRAVLIPLRLWIIKSTTLTVSGQKHTRVKGTACNLWPGASMRKYVERKIRIVPEQDGISRKVSASATVGAWQRCCFCLSLGLPFATFPDHAKPQFRSDLRFAEAICIFRVGCV